MNGVADRRAARRFGRISLALAAALFALTTVACSSTPESVSMSSIQPPAAASAHSSAVGPGAQPPGPPLSKADSEVIGVWRGTSLASCVMTAPNRCNAQQKITFTLVQTNSGLGGYYTCAYGTLNCLSMNVSGKIVRTDLNGSRLTMRVQMPNGSSCRYTGMRKQSDINGGYTCSQGSAVIENGTWRARHEY
ncbi:MAG: hypothetical protein ACREQN_17200 [Candidatus Binataceae bacterium]